MKKTLLFASAAVLLCGCGTGSKYVVEGHIAGLEGTVYMFEGDSLIDSAVVEGGKFRFEGPADITARRTVTDSREGDAQRFGTMFFPEPGDSLDRGQPRRPGRVNACDGHSGKRCELRFPGVGHDADG